MQKLFVANINVPLFDPGFTATLVAESQEILDRLVKEHFEFCESEGGDPTELVVSYSTSYLNRVDHEWSTC